MSLRTFKAVAQLFIAVELHFGSFWLRDHHNARSLLRYTDHSSPLTGNCSKHAASEPIFHPVPLLMPVHAMLHPSSSPLPKLTVCPFSHYHPSSPHLPSPRLFLPFFFTFLLPCSLSSQNLTAAQRRGGKKKNPSLVSLQPSRSGRAEHTSSLFIQTCLSQGYISCLLHFSSSPHALTDIQRERQKRQGLKCKERKKEGGRRKRKGVPLSHGM